MNDELENFFNAARAAIPEAKEISVSIERSTWVKTDDYRCYATVGEIREIATGDTASAAIANCANKFNPSLKEERERITKRLTELDAAAAKGAVGITEGKQP